MRGLLSITWLIGAALLVACAAAPPTASVTPSWTPRPPSPPPTVPGTAGHAIVRATETRPAPTAAPPSMTATPPPTIAPPTPRPAIAPGDYIIGERDFILRLNADGGALLGVPTTARSEFSAAWRGTWRTLGAVGEARFTETADRNPMIYPAAIHFTLAGQQATVEQYGVNDVFYDRDDLDHTLGSGQRHPLVKLLNQLLSQIHYLNYAYPVKDDDLYSEFVRRAVVNFQEVEGLTSDGVADQRTWLQLLSATLQAKVTRTDNQIVISLDVVNVRAGPGTNYPAIDRRYKGEALDVVGKVSGAAAETTWFEICCVDRELGWLRSDTGQFQGVASSVPEAPAGRIPPAPTAAPAQTSSWARRGQALLEKLPDRTADGKPVVYLSFDDGPNSAGPGGGYTQQMLDLLKRSGGHVTFFNVGASVSAWPQLVRAAASSQHYIANHTWDHASLEGMTKEQFLDEVERTRQAILKAAGDLFTLDKDVHYLRPPYGATDANTRRFAAELGYAVVMWDVDPQDWRRPGVQEIADHVLSHVFPGAIVLMHDGGGDRSQSVTALEIILRELSAQGYVFYTIYGN
jgi:peptidoglycan/xylan/chitin deacetylase (PgdA/CDA1 family)